MTRKTLAALVLVLACQALAHADESWVEVAALHDGRTLEVHRSVEFKRGSSDLTSFFHFYPTAYSLRFRHPALPVTISWSGADHVHPIAIGFVGNTPFLAVHGTTAGAIYRNSKLYGCPEVPFAFLRYDLDARRWTPVAPSDAPQAVRRANLASRWDSYWMKSGRLTAHDIAAEHASAERSPAPHFHQVIPRSAEEWRYQYKKQDQTTRYANDCRPPLNAPVDAIFPRDRGVLVASSTAVEPEILERKDFSPAWVIDDSTEEWRRNVRDAARAKRCEPLYQVADPEDKRLVGWIAFVKTATGTKLTERRPELCDDDAMWFFARYSSSPKDDRMVIANVTHAGEVLYRVNFRRPDYWGFIATPTFIRKDGYLYFDWWDASTGMKREVKKIVKIRIKEPLASGN